MRLTVHTDHGLRLLMLLAIEPDVLHTIEEIARRYDISRNHLMKITQTLVQAGFIDSLQSYAQRRMASRWWSASIESTTRALLRRLVVCADRSRRPYGHSSPYSIVIPSMTW
jgi:Rrf2 family nitric oxide-sensitive transcriptional repressor